MTPARRAPRLMLAAALVGAAAFAAMAVAPYGPAPLRLALAFALVVLVPGLGVARWLVAGSDAEWPERLAAGYGLGLGLAAATALAALVLRTDCVWATWALPALGVFLLALPGPRPAPATAAPGQGTGRMTAWAIAALAVAGAALWAGIWGTPLGILTDSPDHIAMVRRMAMDGRVLPLDAMIADTAGVGSDPRKGLYHVALALLVRAGDLDPTAAWRWAGMLLAPIVPLVAYVLARRVTGSRAAGATAALLAPLVYGGGLDTTVLRQAAYPMRVADALSWLVVWAALEALRARGVRSLWLAGALAFAAVTTHLFAAVEIAVLLAALAATIAVGYRHPPLAVRFRSRRAWMSRWTQVAGAAALACAPYVLWRWVQRGAGIDPIHAEPQGLLYWWGDTLFTVDPRAAAEWLGWPALGLLAALPLLWRRRHEGPGPPLLVAATVAGLGIALNPLVLPLVHGVLGYLATRLLWCVPLAPGLAVALVVAARSLAGATGPVTRRLAYLAAGGVAVALLPVLADTATAVRRAPALARSERDASAERWRDLLAALRGSWDGPRVLLSDPFTGYAVPAATGHHVTAVLAQHGNPRDPRGPERRTAARDVLSPYVGPRATLAALRGQKAEAVVLNRRFERPMTYENGVILPEQDAAVLAKFAGRPEYFRAVWASGGAYVFELTDRARSGPLPPADPPPRPFAVAEVPGGSRPVPDGEFVQLGTRVAPQRVAPGDTVFLTTYWRIAGERPVPAGFYVVSTYLDAELAERPRGASPLSKIVRIAAEARTGDRWRVHSFHLPADGLTSPDQWRPGEIIEDRYPVPVHPRAVPGTYRVRVKMMRIPVYPNIRLGDFFRDDDQYSGPAVARLRVGSARSAAAPAPGASRGPVAPSPTLGERRP